MAKQLLENDWQPLLEQEFEQPYYLGLREFLKEEYQRHTVYPPMHDIYQALKDTPYEKVKVVILGQDPYHGPGQAHGLSFSVKPGVAFPPSLRNILKEMKEDIGSDMPVDGTLSKWTEQGVLLLNTVLTVRKGEANSHRGQGWETLTDRIIELLGEREEPMVFILWGKPAQLKEKLIKNDRHLILKAPHPSPLSAHRGFFGSRPFSQTNAFLEEQGIPPIDWSLR